MHKGNRKRLSKEKQNTFKMQITQSQSKEKQDSSKMQITQSQRTRNIAQMFQIN